MCPCSYTTKTALTRAALSGSALFAKALKTVSEVKG